MPTLIKRIFGVMAGMFIAFNTVVHAENIPTKEYNIYFDRADRQFTINTSEGNTPRLNFYTWQDSSNVFVPTGYVCKLMFSPSNDPSEVTAMCTVTGSVMNSTNLVQFNVGSNDLYTTMQKGYAVVKLTSASQVHSYSRGYVNISDAPEVSVLDAVSREVPINWLSTTHSNYVPWGPLQAGSGTTFRAYGTNGQYAIDVTDLANNDLNVKSNLYVGRNAIVTGTMDVAGNVLNRGTNNIMGDLYVGGAASVTGALIVTDTAIFNGGIISYNSSAFSSLVTFYNGIDVDAGQVTFGTNGIDNAGHLIVGGVTHPLGVTNIVGGVGCALFGESMNTWPVTSPYMGTNWGSIQMLYNDSGIFDMRSCRGSLQMGFGADFGSSFPTLGTYGEMHMDSAWGSIQAGWVNGGVATNNTGIGVIQLISLTTGEVAYADCSESIGLGACVLTNNRAIVAGNNLTSKGNETIACGGGYWTTSNVTGDNWVPNYQIVTNLIATEIQGTGHFLMTEEGSGANTTSVLYHVTSNNKTNKIGSFWTSP